MPALSLETDYRPEWVGAIVALPTSITEGGETFRPSAIIWLDVATEMIVGTTIVPPQAALEAAADNLRDTARSPRDGGPAMPSRVRVATSELADALRGAALDGVEVVCAPTPELDGVIDSLFAHMAGDQDDHDLSYLRAGVTTDAVAGMFRATARLYKTRPWKIVPSDHNLIGITSESLGLRAAVVSVIGQAGEVFGFALFESLDDFDQFIDAADAHARGEQAIAPRHLALTYVRRADAGPALREEITKHRWELASAAACPIISAFDPDMVARGPTRAEMLRVEAIAAAIAEIVGKHTVELQRALDGGAPLVLREIIATSGGEIALELTAPHPGQAVDNPFLDDDGMLDEDRVDAYRRDIFARFEASPEARVEHADWGGLLVDYATSQFGTAVESLSAEEVREIIFEIVPRKMSVEPEAAPAIVAGVRALLAFLARERPSPRAAARLAVVEGNASQRLARLLADPSNFGPAKAFVTSGQAAGFDMSSQAGLDAWAKHMRENDLRLPMGRAIAAAPRRESPTQQRAVRQVKKTKRKAQRAARNKNRSR